MRIWHQQDGTGSGSALQQQGKSRGHRQRRGLGVRHLLRVLVLLAAQQGLTMVDGRILSRSSLLEAGAVAVGTLLAPQAAWAQGSCPPIYPPTNLSGTVGASGNSITVTWNNPNNPTRSAWYVKYRQTGGSWSSTVTLSASATTHTFTGLTANTAYEVQIWGDSNATVGGSPCPPGTARNGAVTIYTATVVPSKPTGFTATPGSGTRVILAWENPSDVSITRWEVQQKAGSGNYGGWTPISNSNKDTTSHLVSGLTNGTAYGFKIRAVNDKGNGAVSDEKTATPAAVGGTKAAPVLTAVAGNGQVTLNWTVSDLYQFVDPWAFQQKTGSGQWGSWTLIDGSSATTRTHRVSSLTNGTTYSFRVASYISGSFLNPVSNAVSATPGAKTVNLTSNQPGNSITEGDSGTKTVVITATLSEAAPENGVEVSAAASGTAQRTTKSTNVCELPRQPADADWCRESIDLSIAEGQTEGTITVQIIGDTRDESDETIIYTVGASGWTAANSLTLTIKDDDEARRNSVVAPVLTATAGDGQVTLTWTADTTNPPPTYSFLRWEYKQKSGSGDFGENWTPMGTVRATRTFTVTGLTNNTAYTFKMRAVYSAPRLGLFGSDESNEFTATPSAPGVTISDETLTINEGASDTYTVKLNSKPGGNVTVTPTSNDTGAATALPATLTFTTANWETAQTVTVTGAADTDTTNESVTVSHGVTGYGSVTSGPDVTVTVTDTTKTISLSATSTKITEGDSGRTDVTITVALSEAAPSTITNRFIVRFSLDSASTGKATTQPLSTACTSPTPADADMCWSQYVGSVNAASFNASVVEVSSGTKTGTIKIGILGDTTAENDETLKLRATATGYTAGTLTLTIKDDDGPGVTISDETLTINEDASDTYTVVLNTNPGAQVTVTPTSSDTDKATVSGALNFTTANWETAQTVTVTGVDDGSATIRHRVSGYTGVRNSDIEDVRVTVKPTITPPEDLTIVPGPDRLHLSWTAPTDVNRTGWRVQYRHRADVVSTWGEWSEWTPVTGAAATSYTLTGLSIGLYEVRLAATGADDAFSENATANAEVSTEIRQSYSGISRLLVDEGSSRTIRLRLTSRGTGAVRLTPASANTSLSFNPGSLVFSTANWSEWQTMTVTVGTDENTDNEQAVITYSASGGGYSTIPNQTQVTISDTTPTLTLPTDPAAVTEGTAILLTITSDRELTGTLPVRLTLADRGSSGFTAADVPGALGPRTFNGEFGSSPSRTGTVRILTSADTSAAEGAETYRITLNDGPGYAVGTDATADGTLNDGPSRSVTPPAKPTGLAATAGPGQVTLTWTNPNNASIAYWQVQRKEGTGTYGGWLDISGSGASTTTHRVTNLSSGTAYGFKIRAVNAGGYGAVSDEATATTPSNKTITLSAASTRISEGDSGTKEVVITVTAGEAPASDLVFIIRADRTRSTATTNTKIGTTSCTDPRTPLRSAPSAKSDICYPGPEESNTNFLIPAGTTKGSFVLGILGDTDDEPDETVVLTSIEFFFAPLPDWSLGELTLTIVDDDSAGVAVDPTALTVTERASATYTVVLNTNPGQEVIVTPSSRNTAKATVSGALTFTTNNWSTARKVTVTGVEAGAATIRHRVTGYSGVGNSDIDNVRVTVEEAVPVAPTGFTATAGEGQVVLTWDNPNNAGITGYKVRYGRKSARGSAVWTPIDDSGASTTTHTVTDLDGNVEYSFQVRAVNSAGDGAPTAWEDATTPVVIAAPVLTGATSATSRSIDLTWTHAGSSAGDYISGATSFFQWISSHRLKGTSSWTNNENGGPSVSGGTSRRRVEAGVFNFYPDGAVVEVRIRAAGYNSGGSLVYGPWSNPLEVTYKNDRLAALLFTAPSVQVGVNATKTYTVALTKAYGGTVSMTSGDTGKATVSPPTLTFTAGNYNTAQTVTVSGVANGVTTIGHSFRLTGATADAIPDAGTVPVAVGTGALSGKIITLSAASTSITEGNSDKTDVTITINLAEGAPTGGLSPSFSIDSGSTATGNTNFTPSTTCSNPSPADADMCWGSSGNGLPSSIPAGSTTATWTFSILGDTRDEDDETLKWRATAPGWTAGTLTLTIVDDDGASPGVTISDETLTVTEGASTTYTVVLDTNPGAQVTVTPASNPVAKATVSGALTFTTATNNWSTAQTVTVTGVQAGMATVSHTVSGYSGVSSSDIEDVSVTVNAPVTIQPPTGLTIVPGPDRLYLSWTAPTDANRTGWRVRYRQVTGPSTYGAWSSWTAITGAANQLHPHRFE